MARRQLLPLVALLLLAVPARAADAAKVYVILWFDTEDYILPASDDAAMHVADWLSREGIRATFKVVGEKARTLERRGRQDVIDALKKHEIGFHANWHSTQPSPAMYLSTLGWDEGVAEFERREGPGIEDLKRVFGQSPSCYGQPGSSWGPQSFGALRKWGVPVYLDGGNHVGLDGKPHYYGGLLTLYNLSYILRTRLGGADDLRQTQERFAAARQKLLAEGGGIVSVYYHPCEFVHKEFWDGVNFRRGANPPREEWKLPPAKTPEESRAAYENFEGYVRFMKRFADVQFITAREAATIYRDTAHGRRFTPSEIKEIAAAVGSEISFQSRGDYTLAAGELLTLLNDFFLQSRDREGAVITLRDTPIGPTSRPPILTAPVTIDRGQFTRTAADVADHLTKHGSIPSTVWLGSTPIPPEAYLAVLARLIAADKPLPEQIEIAPATLAAAKYVADDGPNLWGWVIFPPNFRAPELMALAKRQAWTLKPAVRHGPAK